MTKLYHIGIDAMGGDFAPESVFDGVEKALPELPSSCKIVLFGERSLASSLPNYTSLLQSTRLEFVDCGPSVAMDEHPTLAISTKKDSSLVKGCFALAQGKIDCFASAGNSGALLVGGLAFSKTISGVHRPCITATIPRLDGKETLLLDVGINVDAKLEVMLQMAQLAKEYAKHIHKKQAPKIYLLNIGHEAKKGNILSQQVYKSLIDNPAFNFAGNLESREIITSDADIILTDGFTGNIVLKQLEGMYSLLQNLQVSHPFLEKFNYETYGGTPILGLNHNLVLGHGISSGEAIKNMLLLSASLARQPLVEYIKESIAHEE